LQDQGASVRAHDPVVTVLPVELGSAVTLAGDALDAANGAAALVVATAWPEYRDVPASDLMARMAGALVLDANRFLASTIGQHQGVRYFSVGKSHA
jgi:UDPglucose 6-dehydrogenase